MKYPIAFCDYDNTIFDSQRLQVPQTTRQAIARYTAAGGVFVLTTGRMYLSIMKQAQRMALNPQYLICLQGSVGYDFVQGKEVYAHDLPADTWHEVARFAEQNGWTYQIYHDTDVITSFANPYTEEYARYTGVSAVVAGSALSQWDAAKDWKSHKMIVMTPPGEAAARMGALRKAFATLDISQSAPQYIEIVHPTSGKGNGVAAMCRYLGYDIAQSVGFGDETNDMTLLQTAGLGVAVGNANPLLKQVADYVCAPCADGGVGEVLNAIVDGTIDALVGIQ